MSLAAVYEKLVRLAAVYECALSDYKQCMRVACVTGSSV